MPSADIGEAVPHLVEAATFDWKWHYSAPAFAAWMAFVLALSIPKSNHNRRVLLIFIPIIIVNVLWLAFKRIASVPTDSAVQFDTVVQSMALGTAVLWLIGGYFSSLQGSARFLLSFVTVVLVAGMGVLSYCAEFSHETFLFLTLFAILTVTLLAAITVTRAVCKARFRPTRFMLWLALWMLLGGIVAMCGFYIAGSYIMSSGPSMSNISQTLVMIIVAGPILGFGLYLLNLPFMILGFANPFFHERLCGFLSVKPATANTMPSDGDDIAE